MRASLTTAARVAFIFLVPVVGRGGNLDPSELKPCLAGLVHHLVPDLADRGYNVSKSILRFLKQTEGDRPLPFTAPTRANDSHFPKHRAEFARLGIPVHSPEEYVASAREFAGSAGGNRIVFVSKFDGNTYNVDMDDGRVLVLSPRSGKLITYFVADAKRMGYASRSHYVYERLYLGDGRAASIR